MNRLDTRENEQDDWHNCYNDNWQGVITPESFAHPAKFSHGLIRRIYQHAIDEGWLKPGDVVADPFAGVALGALYAADFGLSWIGMELERDFVILSHRNFYKFAKERWCTCGETGNTYLCSMRESVSERVGRDKQTEETKIWPVLQPGLPKQISLFGEEVNAKASGQNERENSLEQGEALESRDAPEAIRGGDEWQPSNGKERELARGKEHQAGWIYTNSGEWQAENGTYSSDGATSRESDESRRGCSSSERGSARQSNREFRSNDALGTYEAPSSERGETANEGANLCDMRENIPINSIDYLQPGVQAAKESAILAKVRRKAEGKYCQTCGKLIVPFPVLYQGDSRRLSEVIGQVVGCVVSSPPYNDISQLGGTNGLKKHGTGLTQGDACFGEYGQTPGQLGSMPSGDVQAVISSPPYPEVMNQSAGANDTEARIERMRQAGIDVDNRANVGGANGVARQAQAYGNTPGQLGAMKAIVSSPPYKTGGHHNHQMDAHNTNGRGQPGYFGGYADESEGQLQGNDETFWAAARTIILQCHKILAPGGYAIWVTKRYVKNGQIVDFTGQWIALCEACGFELIHHHRAMLVKDNGTQEAMAQGEETGAVFTNLLGEVSIEAGAKLRNRKHSVARKSFFRNLYEIKKKAATHWETLERDDKAALLWASHAELWENYHQRLSEDKEPQKPSDKKIISSAQVAAWVRDGQIDYKIETSVDWEDVLCLRKIENSLERIA